MTFDTEEQKIKVMPFLMVIFSLLLVGTLLAYFVIIPSIKHTENTIEKKSLSVKVGNYIEFGSFEQDGDYSNGSEKIEWLVLEKTADKALLISKYGLDCIPFSNEDDISFTNATYNSSATWETSKLRNWLNNSFYNAAFSVDEKTYILNTVVENYDYTLISTGESWTSEDGIVFSPQTSQKVTKSPTNDYLFVFNDEEAEKYFSTSKSRKVKPTQYAKNMGADTSYGDGYHTSWWLRTNPNMNWNHCFVTGKGGISENSLPPTCATITVRPAMWIDIS